MEQPPPLTPQEISEFAGSEYAQLGQPQTVKVFGIMHLIFGGIGVLMVLWSLFVLIAGNPFLKLAGNSPQVEMQTKLQADMMSYTIASTALTVWVTGLMIVAGILLLKGRKSARKWSNCYAISSIAVKIINMVVQVVYVLPMMQKMISGMAPGAAGPGVGAMESVMLASMIVTAVITLIYPVLTLILLNRPNVKTWFANQPA
jgi:hypothetical protein